MNNPKLWQYYNSSGFGCLLTFLLIAFLLGSVGLGWLVNGFLALIAIILILPVVAWLGVSWWVKRNLVVGQCPVCSYEFTGFNNTECRCPSCGEPLKVEHGNFLRLTPPGTIDVEAIEVSVEAIEEESK